MKKQFTYGIIISAALVIGVSGGVIFKRVITPPQEVYDGFNPQALKPDCNKIISEIETYRGSDFENAFNANKLINFALEKYRQCENCYWFCYGLADTFVKQDIRSAQIKNGNKYFEESTSKSSAVAISNRMYQEGKDGAINLYDCGDKGRITIDGDNVNTVFTNTTPTQYTKEEYSNLFGRSLDEMFIYLICEETILEENITKNGSDFIVTVDLDPKYSTFLYKNQMKNISNLDCLPSFSAVNLTFTLTNALRLKQLHVEEDYVATMKVAAPTHGTVDYYYFPDQFLQIPELNESLAYHR